MSEEENEKQEGMSRRDFLRRASKEAVDTGTKLVPGGNLARTALGLNPVRVPWWQTLLHRRQKPTPEPPTEPQEEEENETDA